MEKRPSYGLVATPPGPRNLALVVAQQLRQLGFTVWEQPTASASISLVSASWQCPAGQWFHFQYAHHHPATAPWWGGCSLAVQPPGAAAPQDCFSMTQVRRLREVRLLLLGNERLAQARAVPSPSTPNPALSCPSTPTN